MSEDDNFKKALMEQPFSIITIHISIIKSKVEAGMQFAFT